MNKTFDCMLKIKDTYNVKNVTKSDMFKIFKILIDKYKYSYVQIKIVFQFIFDAYAI